MLETIHKAIHALLQPPKEVGLSCHVPVLMPQSLNTRNFHRIMGRMKGLPLQIPEGLEPWIKGLGITYKDLGINLAKRYSSLVAAKEVESGRSITYEELNRKAAKVANGLLSLGVVKHDRCALYMRNRLEYLIAEQALAKIGAVRVGLNEMLSPDYVKYMLGDSQAKVLITDHELLNKVSPLIEEIKDKVKIVCVSEGGKLPPGVLEFDELLRYSEVEPAIRVSEQDVWEIGYTGGTTGVPKGVVRTHKADLIVTLFQAFEFEIYEREKMLLATPLPHVSGFLFNSCCLKGGTAYIMKRFDIPTFLETIEKEKITWTWGVPTMIYRLLNYPELKKYDLSSLRTFVYGAAPMAPDKLKTAIETFGPIFMQIYGQYEAAMLISKLSKHEHVEAMRDPSKSKILASAGKPYPWLEVKIVDDNDNELPIGSPGEIVVRAPHVMLGYLNKADETSETLRGGWLHTGDVGYLDEDGYLYIVDRKKDRIKTGGMNVYSAEVEKALHEHPAINNVAVIGVPHPDWGEAVKAIVVLNPGYEPSKELEEDIIKFAKKKLPAYAVPKSIDFVNELPVTPYGKIDKKKLREPYWKGLPRRVH